MAKIVTPLVDTQVKQAKPKEKEYSLGDGNGLSLKVMPKGAKLWRFAYLHPITKKKSRLALGKYPDLSLAKAREKAREAKALLAEGIDPKAHRDETLVTKQTALNNTFQVVFNDWLSTQNSKMNETTQKKLVQRMNKYLIPSLGNYPINQISAPLSIKILRPIANKGNFDTLGKVCSVLNRVMVFALNTGLIEHNKLAGIRSAFGTVKSEHQPSLKPEELPELMNAINFADITIITRFLTEWQLHTMVRPAEAAGTKWDEINFETKLWNIPGPRMKELRPHIVPLTKQTLKLLETLHTITGNSEYVFPSYIKNNKNHINKETVNKALHRMGFKGRQTSHGLRALASTTLNDEGFDEDVIEAALSHKDSNQVRNAYNRALYLKRRRELMSWWSNHIVEDSKGSRSVTALKTTQLVN